MEHLDHLKIISEGLHVMWYKVNIFTTESISW